MRRDLACTVCTTLSIKVLIVATQREKIAQACPMMMRHLYATSTIVSLPLPYLYMYVYRTFMFL